MTTPYRSAFKTLLKIYSGAFFAKITNGVESLTFSQEKLHPRCLTRLKIGFWLRVLHIDLTFVPNYKLSQKKTQPEKMCDIVLEKAKDRVRKVNSESFK